VASEPIDALECSTYRPEKPVSCHRLSIMTGTYGFQARENAMRQGDGLCHQRLKSKAEECNGDL
jgi:hypothetical protein